MWNFATNFYVRKCYIPGIFVQMSHIPFLLGLSEMLRTKHSIKHRREESIRLQVILVDVMMLEDIHVRSYWRCKILHLDFRLFQVNAKQLLVGLFFFCHLLYVSVTHDHPWYRTFKYHALGSLSIARPGWTGLHW